MRSGMSPTLYTAVLIIALALCWRVGCDGVLDSRVRFDKCGVCGGDNTSCHIISGIFTRRSLPYGYNKVATIPRGACNINITEIMPNRNFLALKLTAGQYMINGDWVVGSSKEYTAAGTIFRYYRPSPSKLHQTGQKEYIIGKGPTNDSVDIMLLKQQENHGIMYEYTIPMEASPATSQAAKSAHKRDRNRNWTKPEVKGIRPLSLAKADDPLHRPADEARRPSAPKLFQPELSDRYQRYSAQFGNYLGVGQSAPSSAGVPAVAQPKASPYGLGVVDVSRKGVSNKQQQQQQQQLGVVDVSRNGANTQQQQQQQQTPQVAVPNSHHNKKNGHRLRHKGRHGGRKRKLSSAVQPEYVKQYQYQAQSLGPSAGTSGQHNPSSAPVAPQPSSYVYPPVAGVIPQQPLPVVQTSARRHGSYAQPLAAQPQYGSQYQHIIPATRQQRPTGGGQYQQVPAGQQQPYPGAANQQHRYDTVYYQGQQQQHQRGAAQAGSKWALNDQIALSLPGARYPAQGQIGNLDPGSDFTWRISGFTECSKTCGGGTQTTIIVCVKGASQAVVTDENCDNALKPETQAVSCNTRLCPPAWEPTEWSSCSTSCGRGTQTRDVQCRQMVALNDVRPVSAAICRDLAKPDTVRMCHEDKPCVRWKIGDWTKCSADCGRGQKTREVVCANSEDRPIAENKCTGSRPPHVEMCDMGSCAKTWFYTDWSTVCSSSCGEGVYQRKVHCSADPERCRAIRKPEETKICTNDLPCGGQWFTGPWQKCSVTCGPGVTRREVLCMKRLGRMMPVGDENCLSADKPESERPCDNPACQPQWYMTDWTQCTKSCDTGYQQRDVKCLDADQRTTTRCADTDKHDVWRTCSTMPCPTASPDPSCRDEYNNCRLVVQARLCHYSYYKKACCLSCTGGDHDVDHDDADDVTKQKEDQKGESRQEGTQGRRRPT